MFSGERKFFVVSILIGVALLGAAFGGGYYIGNNYQDEAITVDLKNKEPTGISPDAADFEPFWKAWSILSDRYVSKKELPSDQEKIWGAISGLTQSYGDPYTVFLPPIESKQFQETISGEFGGVGMEIGRRDNTITVIAPLKGTPAFNAGVRAGDKILNINASSTVDMTVDEAVNWIRGKKGTVVKLTLLRDGVNKPIELEIVRDTIQVPTLDTEMRQDGIFIIRLYSFSANSPDLFRQALRDFIISGSDRLILDLRGNPGGYLEAAVDMASWYLPMGAVVVREDSSEKDSEKVYRSRGYDVFTDKLKMAILVNRGSASASEILAGALSEHGKAKLYGENTFGKGSVQELISITPETSLKITIARWLTPNDTSISEGGLKPDIEIMPTEEDIEKGRDPVLDRAAADLNG